MSGRVPQQRLLNILCTVSHEQTGWPEPPIAEAVLLIKLHTVLNLISSLASNWIRTCESSSVCHERQRGAADGNATTDL